jgi:hypothetical protein
MFLNKILISQPKHHPIFHFTELFVDRISDLGWSFIYGAIKNILNEFSSADEENEWNTESKVTRCT